jgi:hypothetical protein
MFDWLWKLMWPSKPVDGDRPLSGAERRQQEEIKAQILRKLKEKLREK